LFKLYFYWVFIVGEIERLWQSLIRKTDPYFVKTTLRNYFCFVNWQIVCVQMEKESLD